MYACLRVDRAGSEVFAGAVGSEVVVGLANRRELNF